MQEGGLSGKAARDCSIVRIISHSSQQVFPGRRKQTWKQIGYVWEHGCPESAGRKLLLTRGQMGVYRVDQHGDPVFIGSSWMDGHWVADEPGGCRYCGSYPPELRSIVAEARLRKDGNNPEESE